MVDDLLAVKSFPLNQDNVQHIRYGGMYIRKHIRALGDDLK